LAVGEGDDRRPELSFLLIIMNNDQLFDTIGTADESHSAYVRELAFTQLDPTLSANIDREKGGEDKCRANVAQSADIHYFDSDIRPLSAHCVAVAAGYLDCC